MPKPGDRVVEWFEVEFPSTAAGKHELSLTITDRNGGERVTVTRTLSRAACGP